MRTLGFLGVLLVSCVVFLCSCQSTPKVEPKLRNDTRGRFHKNRHGRRHARFVQRRHRNGRKQSHRRSRLSNRRMKRRRIFDHLLKGDLALTDVQKKQIKNIFEEAKKTKNFDGIREKIAKVLTEEQRKILKKHFRAIRKKRKQKSIGNHKDKQIRSKNG